MDQVRSRTDYSVICNDIIDDDVTDIEDYSIQIVRLLSSEQNRTLFTLKVTLRLHQRYIYIHNKHTHFQDVYKTYIE